MKWMRTLVLIFALLVFGIASAAAVDIVYLQNGEIILGTLTGPVPGGVSYATFGAERKIPLESIASTDKTLTSLADKMVNVVLKDGSSIQGKIVDYDPDIGVFLDISFGTLTIPVVAISEIYETAKRTLFNGTTFQISPYGGVYWPLAGSADYFGMSWYAGVGADWAIPKIRGLYAGGRATIYGMNYKKDSSVKYSMYSVRPEITYKYLGWRMKNNLLGKLVPYVSLGSGPVYIAIQDPASYPSTYGSITADIAMTTGMELSFSSNIVVKLEGNGSLILQKGTPFMNAGVMLSLSYER